MALGIVLMNLRHRFADGNVADLTDTGGMVLSFMSVILMILALMELNFRFGRNTFSLANNYGGLWFRFVAALLDFLFAGSAMVGVTRVVIDLVRLTGVAPNASRRVADLGIVELVILLGWYWVYFAVMESSPLEATIAT